MTNRLATVLASVVLAAGCGKKDDSSAPKKDDTAAQPAAKTTEAPPKQEAPAAKKPLDAALFGKNVGLFGELAKLQWGMTAADARKAAPKMISKKDDGYELSDDPTYDKVSYGIGLDKTGKLNHIVVTIPASARATLEQAWGPGKAAKDTIGKDRTYWFNPETGWRAYAEAGFSKDDLNIELQPYLPVAKLLGDAPDKLGFAPDGILDASLTDLRTRFGDKLIETDAATAEQQQKDLAKFSGVDVDKAVGKAKPSVRVDLPATEWGDFWTRVNIDWSDAGKVKDINFQIPYGAYDPAKEELRALFEQHWGKPKPGKYIVTKVDVYRAKDPWIAVEDDTITHAWTVHVFAKPPKF